MKIFISHSSKNSDYGNALVSLLLGVGIGHDRIIFTSNTAYGIPAGKNIFHWLKERIVEKPYVIYLLSPEYYKSVACLNEMGAAWIVENQHATIFIPGFDLHSSEFRNGAIDSREIGFFLNDEDRVTEFIESLRQDFGVTDNQVAIGNARRTFLHAVNSLPVAPEDAPSMQSSAEPMPVTKEDEEQLVAASLINGMKRTRPSKKIDPTDRYFQDLNNGRLKNAEIMIIHYAADTAQFKLGVGWKAEGELTRIRNWENLNDLGDTLSKQYDTAIQMLDMRNLTTVSETTSHGNPREVMLVESMKEMLLDLPSNFYDKCEEIVRQVTEEKQRSINDEIPF